MNLAFLNNTQVVNTKFVALYCNKAKSDRFVVGEIVDYDSGNVMLHSLSLDAQPDGLLLCSKQYIFRVELKSQYLNNLESIAHVSYANNTFRTKSLWDDFLDAAEKHKEILQFVDSNGKRIMFGIPLKHDETIIEVLRITTTGSTGKNYHLKRSQIAIISKNSANEQTVQKKCVRSLQSC